MKSYLTIAKEDSWAIIISYTGDNSLVRNANCVLRVCTREKLYSKIATSKAIENRFSTLDIIKNK